MPTASDILSDRAFIGYQTTAEENVEELTGLISQARTFREERVEDLPPLEGKTPTEVARTQQQELQQADAARDYAVKHSTLAAIDALGTQIQESQAELLDAHDAAVEATTEYNSKNAFAQILTDMSSIVTGKDKVAESGAALTAAKSKYNMLASMDNELADNFALHSTVQKLSNPYETAATAQAAINNAEAIQQDRVTQLKIANAGVDVASAASIGKAKLDAEAGKVRQATRAVDRERAELSLELQKLSLEQQQRATKKRAESEAEQESRVSSYEDATQLFTDTFGLNIREGAVADVAKNAPGTSNVEKFIVNKAIERVTVAEGEELTLTNTLLEVPEALDSMVAQGARAYNPIISKLSKRITDIAILEAEAVSAAEATYKQEVLRWNQGGQKGAAPVMQLPPALEQKFDAMMAADELVVGNEDVTRSSPYKAMTFAELFVTDRFTSGLAGEATAKIKKTIEISDGYAEGQVATTDRVYHLLIDNVNAGVLSWDAAQAFAGAVGDINVEAVNKQGNLDAIFAGRHYSKFGGIVNIDLSALAHPTSPFTKSASRFQEKLVAAFNLSDEVFPDNTSMIMAVDYTDPASIDVLKAVQQFINLHTKVNLLGDTNAD